MSTPALPAVGDASPVMPALSEVTSDTTSWLGRTVTAVSSFFCDAASAVAEFAVSAFEQIKSFVQEHREYAIGIAIILGAGIVVATIMSCFCKGTTGDGAGGTPPNPAGTGGAVPA